MDYQFGSLGGSLMVAPSLSPIFHIGTIKIGTIEGASCFSIGNNFIEDFKSSKKHTQGLGNIHGDRNNFAHSSASATNYERSANKKEETSLEKPTEEKISTNKTTNLD